MSAPERKSLEERRAERIEQALREGIVRHRLYDPVVAAALLGIHSKRAPKTLADIPAELLPVHHVGPSGGIRAYYGHNLLAYIHRCGAVLNEPEPADTLRFAS